MRAHVCEFWNARSECGHSCCAAGSRCGLVATCNNRLLAAAAARGRRQLSTSQRRSPRRSRGNGDRSPFYPPNSSGETNKAVPDRRPDDLEGQGELFHRVEWLLNLFGGCLLPAGRTLNHRYWFLVIHRLAPRVRRSQNRHGTERGSFLAAHRVRRCLDTFIVSMMSASPRSLVGSRNGLFSPETLGSTGTAGSLISASVEVAFHS